MERRELLRKSLGGLALALVPFRLHKKRETPSPDEERQKDFCELLDEARSSYEWLEFRRAYDLYSQALKKMPPGYETSILAEILEKRKHLREVVKSDSEAALRSEAAIDVSADTGKHYFYGTWLQRLGREEEALAQYETQLRSTKESEFATGCWSGMARYYYKHGPAERALPYLQSIREREDPSEFPGSWEYGRAMELELLVYAKLGRNVEAERTIREYIRRFGRVPWPESRMLRKAGIDADAMYVQQCLQGELKNAVA